MMVNLSFTDSMGHQKAIAALATYPDITQAKEFMAEQGYNLSEAALETVRRNKADEIEEARREVAPRLEAQLTGDMLDDARKITVAMDLAIQRTEERLRRNIEADPSRVLRDLSQVRTQAIDKRLALEGRPTQIIEKRSPDEILAKLEALGVVKQVDVESTAEEDE